MEALVLSQNDKIIENYFPRSRPTFQGGVSPLRRDLGMLVGKLELNPSRKSGRDS